MKLSIKKIILPLVCAGLCTSAQALSLEAAKLERTMTEQIRVEQARVQITLYWEKEVQRSVHRGGVRSMQNQTQRTETTCQGILLEGNVQVAAPASCFKYEDFSLRQMQLSFSNGKQAVASAQSVRLQEDLAYILVKRNVTEGLIGLPVSKLKEGESLQDAYGKSMTDALHKFFSAAGVRFKAPRCRVGSQAYGRASKNTLTVGEPVIFKGKLVALVKEVPHIYGTLFGGVSESALAIFRL